MTVKNLYKPTYNNLPESVHDSSDTNYQVPAGKKFTVYEITSINGGQTPPDAVLLSETATADTATGTQKILLFNAVSDTTLTFVEITFTATKYITFHEQGNVNVWATLIGVEDNA